MNVPDLLRLWSPRKGRGSRRTSFRRRPAPCLLVEPLEPRWLPSINTLVSLANGPTGTSAKAGLIEDSAGDLFGTTQFGGASNHGTVFKVEALSGFINTLASFSGTNGAIPEGGLVEDASGDLFGTTLSGGTSNDGTVYELQYNSGSYNLITLVNFTGTGGANPGQSPQGDLVLDAGGNLFGTTNLGGAANGGTIFELKVFSSSIITLAGFTAGNGAIPGLVMDSSGDLFGTTNTGGASGDGIVYELQKSGFAYSLNTLATFSGPNGSGPTSKLAMDSSGDLFGTTTSGGTSTLGTVFELQKSGGSYTLGTLASFSSPVGGDAIGGVIRDNNGNLFGATVSAGPSGDGTLYEVKNGSGAITMLAAFSGTNGSGAESGLLVDSSGNLFGTALSGAAYGQGTIFELPAGSSTITSLGAFNGSPSGIAPSGTLLEDSSGNLIGTAAAGGPANDGTIFKVAAATGIVTTLASFSGTNGAAPFGGLVKDSSGNFFGTTGSGGSGSFNDGTIFELPAGSSTITTLVSFTGTGGANPGQDPQGELVLDSSGNLFGTTESGGSSNDGTVFELKFSASTITPLATFTGSNGSTPMQGLTLDSSGNLFGTTRLGGGTANDGIVYELQKSGSSYSFATLATSNSTVGLSRAGVIRDSSGNLFGATGNEGTLPFPFGTVYEVKNGSGTMVPLGAFTQAGGDFVLGNLVEDSSGNLFGSAQDGGAFGGGSIFEVPSRTPPVITTSSLANWTAQNPGYSQTLSTSGGTGSSTFSSSGTLPTGLTLASTGILSGTPTTPGTYSFTVTATDALGATGNHGYTVTINPPVTIATTTLANGTLNQAYSQSITASGGTGTLVFSQTGGTLPAGLLLSGGGILSGTPTAEGSFTFTLTATDSVGASASQTFTVTMVGPPVKLAFLVQPVNTTTSMILSAVSVEVLDGSGDVVTSDNSDIVTLGVASGPGVFLTGSTTSATSHNGVATFSNLAFAVPGTYTLSELVPTLYTGPNSTPFSVAPLQVVAGSFAGTPSGFSVQFNAPFLVNSVTPVLYGHGFGAMAPAPTVIVTTDPGNLSDTAAYVEGSLVLNTATNSMTFVATNTAYEANKGAPQLPDGTYTVVLRSSAASDGFQALASGGGFLDGLGTGTPGSGDFTHTFTVNVAANHEDVVWVPATADGPGQALSAPGKNQAGGGYPIYLDDGTGSVTSVQLTLNYNPALLGVTGASGADFTLLGSSTPGHANLQYSGPALPAGSKTPLGFLTASVPGGTIANPTPYKAKDLLHLSNVTVNGGLAATSDALHLVAYVGDGDGNGAYSANDAVLITRALLSTDSGFTAYPLVDPVVVADTDGSGFIPADAALQASEAGVGLMTANLPVPPIPSGVVFQAVPNNVDPSMSIPSHLQVEADGRVHVTVNLDDAHPAGSTGLIEAHLALTYDPRQFTVSAADIHLGSLLSGGGWSMVPTIDPSTGQIGIALLSSMPISAALGGSLVTIVFHQMGQLSNPSRIDLVAAATPAGQPVTTELEDAQGIFALTIINGTTWVDGSARE